MTGNQHLSRRRLLTGAAAFGGVLLLTPPPAARAAAATADSAASRSTRPPRRRAATAAARPLPAGHAARAGRRRRRPVQGHRPGRGDHGGGHQPGGTAHRPQHVPRAGGEGRHLLERRTAEPPQAAARPRRGDHRIGERAAPVRPQRHQRRLHRPLPGLDAWERELDVLALHGINRVLVYTAATPSTTTPSGSSATRTPRCGRGFRHRPISRGGCCRTCRGSAARCPGGSSTRRADLGRRRSPTGCGNSA